VVGEALALGLAIVATTALAQPFEVVGGCRSGLPNGAYELHEEDGQLRVAGAFAHGRKTGTFIFWSAGGARQAVIPYDDDLRSGTVALWYTSRDGHAEAGRRLEAPYVDDRLHGIVRSWHANGARRAEYRYDHGTLLEAHAWTEGGVELPEAEAHSLALRDAEDDQRYCDRLVALIRAHLPRCD
jgi:antitoxin component YwqK of YwqJK toxin-antitoxin module